MRARVLVVFFCWYCATTVYWSSSTEVIYLNRSFAGPQTPAHLRNTQPAAWSSYPPAHLRSLRITAPTSMSNLASHCPHTQTPAPTHTPINTQPGHNPHYSTTPTPRPITHTHTHHTHTHTHTVHPHRTDTTDTTRPTALPH